MIGGLTQGKMAYRMFGLRCGCCTYCLNNKMLSSRYSCLMFLVLKQFIALLVRCVMLKHMPSPPPFELGYVSMWKINTSKYNIHWIFLLLLLCNSVPFLSNLSSSYLIFLIHMSLFFNRQTLSRLDPNKGIRQFIF